MPAPGRLEFQEHGMRNVLRTLGALAVAVGAAACDAGLPLQPAPGSPGELRYGTTATGATISAVITPKGGSLALNGHELRVPAGTVEEPARFSMTDLSVLGWIGVELDASGVATKTDLNDALRRTVFLSLSYAGSKLDESSLCVWSVEDATCVPSVVDPDRRIVTAELSHFSQYVLVSN
jgi:hypothetical protein